MTRNYSNGNNLIRDRLVFGSWLISGFCDRKHLVNVTEVSGVHGSVMRCCLRPVLTNSVQNLSKNSPKIVQKMPKYCPLNAAINKLNGSIEKHRG